MIEFACPCGQVMKVADGMSGRKGKCPKCGAMLLVPAAPAEEVPVLDAAVPEGPSTEDLKQMAGAISAIKQTVHVPITGAFGLLLLIAFFLPFMRIRCAGTVIAEPSGYHLALDKMDSTLGDLGSAGNSSSSSGGMTVKSKDAPWGGTTPELFFFPILGLAMAGWAYMRLKFPGDGLPRETRSMLIVCALGVVMLVVEKVRDYRKPAITDMRQQMADQAKSAPTPPASGNPFGSSTSNPFSSAMGDALVIEAGSGFYLTLVSLIAAILAQGWWLGSTVSPPRRLRAPPR